MSLLTDRRALALLVLLHLAGVAIVQPRGEFPINDDWAFAQSVRWLLEDGKLRPSDWVPMYHVPQTLLAALAASAFGLSFEVLRHVTQFVAVAALGLTFLWFRAVDLPTRDALVGTIVVSALPFWPVLANSYMTDMYALALVMPAGIFLVKALDRPSPRFIALGAVFSAAAALQRQPALVLPLAFAVAWVWTRRPFGVRRALAGFVPFALALAATSAYHAYLAAGPGVPEMTTATYARLVRFVSKMVEGDPAHRDLVQTNVLSIPLYLGLFSTGWLLWWGFARATRAEKLVVWGGGFAIVLLTAMAPAWLPPYRVGHVMDARGIAPLMLYDGVRAGWPHRGDWFWWIVAIPAAFATGGVILAALKALGRLAARWRSPEPRLVFLLAVNAAYLVPFALSDYFDRYLLLILPFLLALWASLWPAAEGRAARVFAMAWLAFALAMASTATHDYFAWNRARWDAIRLAERLGGTPDTIDGGFEYNAYHRFEKRADAPREPKSWYWVRDDYYVVAFSRVPGYDEIETFRVKRWLPVSPAEIKLLRRKG